MVLPGAQPCGLFQPHRQSAQQGLAQRQGGDPKKWVYNEHSVTVQELDPGKGEAVVEIGSFYGPLTGAGVQYLLRREGGQWQKVSEETVWIT